MKCEVRCEECCIKFYFLWFCWLTHTINTHDILPFFIRMTMPSLLAMWHNNSALPVFTLESCSFRSWPSTFINLFFSVNVPTITKNKNSQMFHFMITQQQVQYVRWFPFLEFSGRGLKHLYIGFKNKAIFCIIILHYQILFYII